MGRERENREGFTGAMGKEHQDSSRCHSQVRGTALHNASSGQCDQGQGEPVQTWKLP